jgi:pimeloyl-ACP methyl ester carboxylesterase
MGLSRRAGLLRRWFKQGVSADMSSDSRSLLVAFGGLAQGLGMPPFEFFGATGGIPVKRLFVRDPRQSWYHQGIFGHGRSLVATADSLAKLIARHDVERLVMTGNSMGGYAALAFGTLLGADTVLCFSPQTVLDLDVLAEMDDHQWDRRLGELAAAGRLDTSWTDLRKALPRARHTNTDYQIYFAEPFRADRLHAERLRGIEGVRLFRFGRGAHGLAGALRSSGALERILRGALDPAPRESEKEIVGASDRDSRPEPRA